MTLSQSGADAYYVLDYWGSQVSSGSVSGTTCVPAAPTGGWKPGWYRIYFTGASSDAVFGPSYAATNFCVIRPNANFHVMPAVGVPAMVQGDGSSTQLDPAMRGVMGVGPPRQVINDAANINVGSGTGNKIDNLVIDAGTTSTYWPLTADTARPRYMWCAFTNGGYDVLFLPATSGTYLNVYATTAHASDAQTVFVSIGAGSSSGAKIQVFYPNSSTLVATYDNLANPDAGVAAINGVDSYIRVQKSLNANSGLPGTLAATAVGPVTGSTNRYQGVASVVSTLYPLGVTRFEGPINEPTLSANTVEQMRLFQAAVHAGNASAKAIGPTTVSIFPLTGAQTWDTFLAAGGAAYCDEIAFHDYNTTVNGDMNQGRSQIAAFLALLASYGVSKPLWQTEATNVFSSVFRVYHPHRSRVVLMMTLLWEQSGIPRERNTFWYDYSHGFWSYSSWLENGDTSLNPMAVMFRVLAEETFGQTHSQQLTFGSPGDNVWLGSVYATPGSGPSTVVLMPTSYLPSGSVTLAVTGTTSPLTVVDCLGNASTVPISAGLAVIPAAELTYVRLPTGATVTVNTWNGAASQQTNPSASATATIGGVSSTKLNDGAFLTSYGGTAGTDLGAVFSTGSMPNDIAQLAWTTDQTLNRLIIWCGGVWQNLAALAAFQVQTSEDGTTWTTQASVTNSTCSSFWHGTDSTNAGCQYETYWNEQWIYDVQFAPVACKYIRVLATQTSYGGEPDANAVAGGQGQGQATQQLVIQEMTAMLNTTPVYAVPPAAQVAVRI